MRQAAESAAVAHFLLSVLTGVSGHVRSASAWLAEGRGRHVVVSGSAVTDTLVRYFPFLFVIATRLRAALGRGIEAAQWSIGKGGVHVCNLQVADGSFAAGMFAGGFRFQL